MNKKQHIERTIKEMEEKIKDWTTAVEFLKLHVETMGDTDE
jgi:hypothetical protein